LALSVREKVELIDWCNSDISIRRQCELLGLNRSSYYYEPRPQVSAEDEAVMKEIDRIYTWRSYYGVRRITWQLQEEGIQINHKRVHRLMQIMGIQAVYPKPNFSKPDKANQVYPYLLKDVIISRPNQVWGVDITYIRMKREWLYLVAILDWYSRYIVSWELSDNLGMWFCCEALERALKVSIPEIHNSDQGVQFTSNEYVNILKRNKNTRISMDHKGRCFDNIFTERLWRTIKYEEVYLKEYDSPREARRSLSEYINIYNTDRPHQSLKMRKPKDVYYQNVTN
jgi:putative transposase